MKQSNIVILVIAICITLIEVVALLTGVDGQMFATTIAGLCGLAGLGGGYQFAKRAQK